MVVLVEQAVSDAIKVFLVGMGIYSVFAMVLLRFTFNRTQGFARKNLRDLRKLKSFMEKAKAPAGEGSAESGELLDRLIARYRPGFDVSSSAER